MILESIEIRSGRVVEMSYDVVSTVRGGVNGEVSSGYGSVSGSVSSGVYYSYDLVLVNSVGKHVKFRSLKAREKICLVGDVLEFEYFNTGMVVLKNLDSGLKFVLDKGKDWERNIFSYYKREDLLKKSKNWVKYLNCLFILLLVLCWCERQSLIGVYDIDGDGYLALEDGGWDCDDHNSKVNAGSVEIPGNGIDDDCRDGDASITSRNMEPLALRSPATLNFTGGDSMEKKKVVMKINWKMGFIMFGIFLVWLLCLMGIYWRRDVYIDKLMAYDKMLAQI